MARGLARVRRYGASHRGVDVAALARAVEADITRLDSLDRGDPLPPLEPPRV